MADIIAISGILNTLALLFKNGKREDLVSYGMLLTHLHFLSMMAIEIG